MQTHIHIHRSRSKDTRARDDYASSIKATLPEISMGKVLREANEPVFRSIVDRLRSDKSVSVAELKDIIRGAFNQNSLSSSRSGLIDQIEKEFIREARFANKLR